MPEVGRRGSTSEAVTAALGQLPTSGQWRAIEPVITTLAERGRRPLSALPEGLDPAIFFAGCRELALPVRQQGDHLVWQPAAAMLDPGRIRVDAGIAPQSCDIRVLPLVDSSNERLKRIAEAGTSAHILFAEAQWAGRGRRERRWRSRFGESVMLSLRIATGRPLSELPGMAIVAGVAVGHCLRGLGVGGIGLKWPNDLLLDGAKVGGILVEAVTSAAQREAKMAGRDGTVVIGIGLNWQSPDHAGVGLGQPVAGLAGRLDGGREALAGAVLASLLDAVARFSTDGISPFLGGFEQLDELAGQEVMVEEHGRRQRGIARGLTDDGALRVEHDDGERIHRSAQVSLRRSSAPLAAHAPVSCVDSPVETDRRP